MWDGAARQQALHGAAYFGGKSRRGHASDMCHTRRVVLTYLMCASEMSLLAATDEADDQWRTKVHRCTGLAARSSLSPSCCPCRPPWPLRGSTSCPTS